MSTNTALRALIERVDSSTYEAMTFNGALVAALARVALQAHVQWEAIEAMAELVDALRDLDRVLKEQSHD